LKRSRCHTGSRATDRRRREAASGNRTPERFNALPDARHKPTNALAYDADALPDPDGNRRGRKSFADKTPNWIADRRARTKRCVYGTHRVLVGVRLVDHGVADAIQPEPVGSLAKKSVNPSRDMM
jgi:hypothetical protein